MVSTKNKFFDLGNKDSKKKNSGFSDKNTTIKTLKMLQNKTTQKQLL